jgi:hypothetical protein
MKQEERGNIISNWLKENYNSEIDNKVLNEMVDILLLHRDEMAVDFANWLVLYYTEEIFYKERYTEKLLEIYKKEKGL